MFEVAKSAIQIFALIISIVLNVLLTYLILTKSSSKMGSYKYIMMFLSLSALVYSLLSVVVRPDIVSYSSCFVIYAKNSTAFFAPDVTVVLISCICGFYFFFSSIIAVHFVYRYNALKNGAQRFRRKFYIFLFMIPPILYVNWTLNCLLAFLPNRKSTSFLRNRMMADLGIDVDAVTYIIADFYVTDYYGRPSPNVITFVSGFNFLIMTMFSLSIIIVFAFKCYFEMKNVIVPGRNCSLTHKLLHTQLFRALIFQTLIPLIIMYIPLFLLFVFPMLNIDVGFAQYVSLSISIYPGLDSLPTLFFVRDYRDSVLRCCEKKTSTRSLEPYSVRRGSLVFTAPRKSTTRLDLN